MSGTNPVERDGLAKRLAQRKFLTTRLAVPSASSSERGYKHVRKEGGQVFMSNAKDREARLQYNRLYMSKLVVRRRESGLCVNCGKPARIGKTQCQSCVEDDKRRKLKQRKMLKKKAVEYLGGLCVDCGIVSEYPEIYDFHHWDADNKDMKISRLIDTTRDWRKIQVELDKCVLLCSNCHRIRHAKEDGERISGRSPNPDFC